MPICRSGCRLTDRYDVVVFDIRNHGENPLHDPDAHRWETFYDDYEEIFHGIKAHFGEALTIGAFHSLSSVAALEHTLADRASVGMVCACSIRRSCRARAIRFIKRSTVQYGSGTRIARCGGWRHSIHRNSSPSQFRRRSSFGRWVPGAAALLARHTMRANG